MNERRGGTISLGVIDAAPETHEPQTSILCAAAMINRGLDELERAYATHGRDHWGRHEFYGIIREEFDEMWDCIKEDAPTEELLSEMAQIIAMILRYCETGNRYGGSL